MINATYGFTKTYTTQTDGSNENVNFLYFVSRVFRTPLSYIHKIQYHLCSDFSFYQYTHYMLTLHNTHNTHTRTHTHTHSHTNNWISITLRSMYRFAEEFFSFFFILFYPNCTSMDALVCVPNDDFRIQNTIKCTYDSVDCIVNGIRLKH